MKNSNQVPINISGDSFYSPEAGVLYLCVPKVASRSILQICESSFADGRVLKEQKVDYHRLFQSLSKTVFSFSFVRDPIERVLSFYYDKCVNFDGSPGKVAMFARYKNLEPTIELNNFIKWLNSDEGQDYNADHHFCSQYLFIYSRDWKKCVNYVGNFKTLPDDLSSIWTRLGRVLPTLPHLNSNADSSIRKMIIPSCNYASELSSAQIRALRKRYEADYDLFDFGSPAGGGVSNLLRHIRTLQRLAGFYKAVV